MSDSPVHPRREAILLGLVAVVAVAGLIAIYFVWTANVNTHRLLYGGCRGERESLAERGYPAEDVAFRSRLGVELNGWYTEGVGYPNTAIIVIPGIGSNTCYALPEAELLVQAGYSTLIYEQHSCADSMLPDTAGPQESLGLLGAVDYLAARPGVERIGVLGFSEGASAAILAAAEEPRIEAVVAVGSYASLEDQILAVHEGLNLHDRLVRRLMLWFIEREGVPLDEARPVDAVARIGPRPLLLIHAGCDEAAGRELAAAADPETTELWIVPEADRGGLAQFDTAAYRDRVIPFFDAAFGAAPGQAGTGLPATSEHPWPTELSSVP